MENSEEPQVTIAREVVEANVGGEAVLLHLSSSTYFGLDETGTLVWNAIKAGRTPKLIGHELADRFGIDPKQAEEDVLRFLAELETHSIVLISGGLR